MARPKRISLVVVLITTSIVSLFICRGVYVWWHIPEAYAAWDAGDMLVWYMRTHDNKWPDDWDVLSAAVESEPSLFLRGRHLDEPDYMDRMKQTISVDWDFDPTAPLNATPILRADGRRLHAYWSDPNGMVYQHLGLDVPESG